MEANDGDGGDHRGNDGGGRIALTTRTSAETEKRAPRIGGGGGLGG
jgi:hypothetical protein